MKKWRIEILGWGSTIEDESLDWKAKRDKLVEILKASAWYKDEDDDLGMAIMDLEDSPTIEDADEAIWEIYNLADHDRVWLSPWDVVTQTPVE